jgi:hypothetical protein
VIALIKANNSQNGVKRRKYKAEIYAIISAMNLPYYREKLYPMTNIYFSQMQFPVGQGGFHMGFLLKAHDRSFNLSPFLGSPLFVWAYDCGSDQISMLERDIKRVERSRVNLLFLSHLDDDHVIGVDKFLMATDEVQEVVLPYLNDVEWALHLASGASSASLSGTFIDLVSDPAAWFGTRGVRRLTFVDCHDEEGEGPDRPDLIDPTGEGPGPLDGETKPVEGEWSQVNSRTSVPIPGSTDNLDVRSVPKGAVVSINSGYGQINWVLSPFAFSPSTSKLNAFASALNNYFDPGSTAQDYANAARTANGRQKLRVCYDAVWKTHNLNSMALYAGPVTTPSLKLHCTARQGNFLRRVVQPGWISTGDFDFSVKKRRQMLLSYYKDYASMVGQMMLSHHGSDHSFDGSVLSAFPDLTFAIAAVGTNGHGHPGRVVQDTVDATPGPSFVRVDESGSSFFNVGGLVQG